MAFLFFLIWKSCTIVDDYHRGGVHVFHTVALIVDGPDYFVLTEQAAEHEENLKELQFRRPNAAYFDSKE